MMKWLDQEFVCLKI